MHQTLLSFQEQFKTHEQKQAHHYYFNPRGAKEKINEKQTSI